MNVLIDYLPRVDVRGGDEVAARHFRNRKSGPKAERRYYTATSLK